MQKFIFGNNTATVKTAMSKTLVVYYSWSGNTRKIAEWIQKHTGGDLFELVPVKPYPSEYSQCTAMAKQEIAAGHKPELKGTPPNLPQYDTVFIGTPNWWSSIAPPIASFLAANDFARKTLIPFCTHGGGGLARCFSDMKPYIPPDAAFLDGFYISGSSAGSAESKVSDWLKKLPLPV